MQTTTDTTVHCARCGAECKPQGITTGYGTAPNGDRHCFECCAEVERARMVETGRADLYLTDGEVRDWPGKLRFAARNVSRSQHRAFGRYVPRVDADFTGPDGYVWHATVRGDMDLARCKRTKRKA